MNELTLDKIQLVIGRIVLDSQLQIESLREQLAQLQARVAELEGQGKSKAA